MGGLFGGGGGKGKKPDASKFGVPMNDRFNTDAGTSTLAAPAPTPAPAATVPAAVSLPIAPTATPEQQTLARRRAGQTIAGGGYGGLLGGQMLGGG